MIRHLFILIWNKKKQNLGLIIEMFVSFLVLFAVFSLMVNFYNNYKKPRGFNYEDVWVITYTNPENIQSNDSMMLFAATLRNTLKSMPQVKELTFTGGNVPYSANTNTTVVGTADSKSAQTNNYDVERLYKDVMDIRLADGRWFDATDRAGTYKPAVINEHLATEVFGTEKATGKILGERNFQTGKFENRFKIIGVVENIKDKGDYHAVEGSLFRFMDSAAYRWNSTILMKVHPGADAAFESRLFKTMSDLTGSSIEIEHLEKKRISKNKLSLVPMIIMLIVGGFLIINVALGLFGVLWYNINKRRGEIGLRRAIGASGNAVSKQLVVEALVLSTLALFIGVFFAVQFPLLHVFDLPASVYIAAILLAIAFIYVLVFLCALYPGKQAAAIYPAVALHEE